MNGFAAPVSFVTADGKLSGVGATVYGAVGADKLIGGAVTALLYDTPMDSGAAWVAVGTADVFVAQLSATTLTWGNAVSAGGADNDVIDGGNDDDSILGDPGDDTVDGGSGNDSLRGLDGFDTAVFSGARAGYTVREVEGDEKARWWSVANSRNGSSKPLSLVKNYYRHSATLKNGPTA